MGLGHRAQHLPDVREREFAALQRLECRLVNRLADRLALLGRCFREPVDQRDLIDAVFQDHDKLLIACAGRR
jgi:hypothetical protein